VPEFVNPFSGKVPDRPLSKEEVIRAIRLDIAAEHEATHLYMAHAEAIDDPVAKAVLIDIANEERVHVGEFNRLLSILTGDEDQWLARGAAEVDELAAQAMAATAGPAAAGTGGSAPAVAENAATAPGAGQAPPTGAEPTLGSLRP
jgi:Mn-containing catalase